MEASDMVVYIGLAISLLGTTLTFVHSERTRQAQQLQFNKQLELQKRQAEEEIKRDYSEQAEQMGKAYKGLFEELKTRIEWLEGENTRKDRKLAELQTRLEQEVARNEPLVRENEDLRRKVAGLQAQIDQLSRAVGG